CALIAAMPAPHSAVLFPRVALIGRYATPAIAEPLSRLAAFVSSRGHAVTIDAETARSAPIPGYPTAPREKLADVADVAIVIGGGFVYALRSDGLSVATPTGSTAYSLSAQGPIVDPQVPALLLVPVAPHALTNRPIAVCDAATITVTLLRGSDAWAHCDAQAHFPLQEGDRVTIRCARCSVRLLHPEGYDHFAMLRQKLHWSETPERLRP